MYLANVQNPTLKKYLEPLSKFLNIIILSFAKNVINFFKVKHMPNFHESKNIIFLLAIFSFQR